MLETGAVDGEGPVAGLKLHARGVGTGGVEGLRAATVGTLDAHRGLGVASRHRSTQCAALYNNTESSFIISNQHTALYNNTATTLKNSVSYFLIIVAQNFKLRVLLFTKGKSNAHISLLFAALTQQTS